jgi:hypothetical protein
MNPAEQDVEDHRPQGADADAQGGGGGDELPHRPIIRPLSCTVQTAQRGYEGYDRSTTIIHPCLTLSELGTTTVKGVVAQRRKVHFGVFS